METIFAIVSGVVSSLFTVIGLYIGFRQFNKTHTLNTVAVRAEAASDNANAAKTMMDVYKEMFDARLERDKGFAELSVEFTTLRKEVEGLKADREREKQRADQFEKLTRELQRQLDDERMKRLEVQDERDSLKQQISQLREEFDTFRNSVKATKPLSPEVATSSGI